MPFVAISGRQVTAFEGRTMVPVAWVNWRDLLIQELELIYSVCRWNCNNGVGGDVEEEEELPSSQNQTAHVTIFQLCSLRQTLYHPAGIWLSDMADLRIVCMDSHTNTVVDPTSYYC